MSVPDDTRDDAPRAFLATFGELVAPSGRAPTDGVHDPRFVAVALLVPARRVASLRASVDGIRASYAGAGLQGEIEQPFGGVDREILEATQTALELADIVFETAQVRADHAQVRMALDHAIARRDQLGVRRVVEATVHVPLRIL